MRKSFGKLILAWAVNMFGDYANDIGERASRLLEETVELAQASGVLKETAIKIVERAYSRPMGDCAKELGQVGLCLESYAAAASIDLDVEIGVELIRVLSIPRAVWQERAAAKKAAGTENVNAS